MSGAMTPRECAEAIEAVERRAAERGLRLERREQTGGEWVYDIRDEHGGIAVRGVRLAQLVTYLREREWEA